MTRYKYKTSNHLHKTGDEADTTKNFKLNSNMANKKYFVEYHYTIIIPIYSIYIQI